MQDKSATHNITTVVLAPEATANQTVTVLLNPDEKKKVQWEDGTIDNEFMNKKKSKSM